MLARLARRDALVPRRDARHDVGASPARAARVQSRSIAGVCDAVSIRARCAKKVDVSIVTHTRSVEIYAGLNVTRIRNRARVRAKINTRARNPRTMHRAFFQARKSTPFAHVRGSRRHARALGPRARASIETRTARRSLPSPSKPRRRAGRETAPRRRESDLERDGARAVDANRGRGRAGRDGRRPGAVLRRRGGRKPEKRTRTRRSRRRSTPPVLSLIHI